MSKSIKINAFYSFLKSFMSLVFPLITFPYASRILEPEGIGKINFATHVVTYFAMIAALGIAQYGTRQAARVRDNKIELTKLVKEIFLINLISTVISYILFFISLNIVEKFSDYRLLLCTCMIKIIFITVGFDWLFRALEEFRYITLRTILFQIIGIAFLFLFVKTKQDILCYAIFGIIADVGSNICNLFYTRKYIDWKQKITYELKKHLKPILIFFSMSVSIMIYTAMDTVMIGFLSTDTEVGYYSAAIRINKMILGILTAVISILLPRLSYYYEKKNYEEFKVLAQNGLCTIQLLAYPMMAGLITLAPSLIFILCGEKYYNAILTMRIITPVFLILSTTWMTSQVLTATGMEKFSLISNISGAITNLTVNYILIPKYGANGAAIGTVLTELIVFLVQFTFSRKYFLSKSVFINFIQTIIATSVMGISIYYVSLLLTNPLLKCISVFTTGVVIYIVILLLLRNSYLINIINTFKVKIENRK